MGISVLVASWNVNSSSPQERLDDLLLRNVSPEIYAIGLQELEHTRYNKYANRKSDKEQEWEACLDDTLRGYARLTTARSDGTALFVYIREDLTPVVEQLESKECGLYSSNVNERKGAIGVRFWMGGVSFCFVNCHLCPHPENVDNANKEFRLICDVLKFPCGSYIHEHDHTFILGDINFKESPDHSDGDSYNSSEGDVEMEHIIPGFLEGRMSTRSRFGYHMRNSSSEVSGCDRILYCGKHSAVKQDEYATHTQYRISDHKPITARYQFKFPTYVEIKYTPGWNYSC